jgi:hypothetical protein
VGTRKTLLALARTGQAARAQGYMSLWHPS